MVKFNMHLVQQCYFGEFIQLYIGKIIFLKMTAGKRIERFHWPHSWCATCVIVRSFVCLFVFFVGVFLRCGTFNIYITALPWSTTSWTVLAIISVTQLCWLTERIMTHHRRAPNCAPIQRGSLGNALADPAKVGRRLWLRSSSGKSLRGAGVWLFVQVS